MIQDADRTSLRHGVVVLAAGASRRLGRPKQLVEIDGETLLHRTVRLALTTRPADLVVVVSHAADASAGAVSDLSVRCVEAAAADAGMGISLQCGFDALADVDAVLVLVCDQPALDASHLATLLARWCDRPQHAVASGYAGTFGVPAIVPRAWLRTVRLAGDQGARAVLRTRADEVQVVANEALAADIDRPADLPAGAPRR
ncbi:MAG TPA: nucleotidyltransferase family protein [Tahibacter sp.]|uniref:nucleotidyltransferase family protein n=1 Tax=Tahibacter sp. TaxID=2056211 RepID=UPI002C5465B6|nr:nucleotidyltransferase family protein [Tahibacter sp.]HSX61526.1 nucleotidyltransferase family protein [Tahibacter sp.]